MFRLCIVITALLCFLGPVHSTTVDNGIIGWSSSQSEIYLFGRRSSYFSPDGDNYAYIDGANWSEVWGEIYRFKKPVGYLFQTIRPRNYLSKHIHVSGLVKTVAADIDGAVNKYKEQLEAELTEKYGEVGESNPGKRGELIAFQVQNVRKFIEYHNKNVEYGISVFLHTPDKIYRQDMTQAPMKESSDWWRLNVEVGIPIDCEFVTVAIWSTGFLEIAVDHLAVVEQGDILDKDKNYARI